MAFSVMESSALLLQLGSRRIHQRLAFRRPHPKIWVRLEMTYSLTQENQKGNDLINRNILGNNPKRDVQGAAIGNLSEYLARHYWPTGSGSKRRVLISYFRRQRLKIHQEAVCHFAVPSRLAWTTISKRSRIRSWRVNFAIYCLYLLSQQNQDKGYCQGASLIDLRCQLLCRIYHRDLRPMGMPIDRTNLWIL